MDDETHIVFRSGSAAVQILIQMSREMTHDGCDGNQHIERTVMFLEELFAKWTEAKAQHWVTIVLFSRRVYPVGTSLSEFAPALRPAIRRAPNQQLYRDYYQVAVQGVQSNVASDTMLRVKRELNRFDQLLHAMSANEPVGVVTAAENGNTLEAINLALNTFERHHIDRTLDRTGLSIVVVTPGLGLMDVAPDLVFISRQRAIDNGIACDMVCLGDPPLHVTPLFRWHAASNFPSDTTAEQQSLSQASAAPPVRSDHTQLRPAAQESEQTSGQDPAESTKVSNDPTSEAGGAALALPDGKPASAPAVPTAAPAPATSTASALPRSASTGAPAALHLPLSMPLGIDHFYRIPHWIHQSFYAQATRPLLESSARPWITFKHLPDRLLGVNAEARRVEALRKTGQAKVLSAAGHSEPASVLAAPLTGAEQVSSTSRLLHGRHAQTAAGTVAAFAAASTSTLGMRANHFLKRALAARQYEEHDLQVWLPMRERVAATRAVPPSESEDGLAGFRSTNNSSQDLLSQSLGHQRPGSFTGASETAGPSTSANGIDHAAESRTNRDNDQPRSSDPQTGPPASTAAVNEVSAMAAMMDSARKPARSVARRRSSKTFSTSGTSKPRAIMTTMAEGNEAEEDEHRAASVDSHGPAVLVPSSTANASGSPIGATDRELPTRQLSRRPASSQPSQAIAALSLASSPPTVLWTASSRSDGGQLLSGSSSAFRMHSHSDAAQSGPLPLLGGNLLPKTDLGISMGRQSSTSGVSAVRHHGPHRGGASGTLGSVSGLAVRSVSNLAAPGLGHFDFRDDPASALLSPSTAQEKSLRASRRRNSDFPFRRLLPPNMAEADGLSDTDSHIGSMANIVNPFDWHELQPAFTEGQRRWAHVFPKAYAASDHPYGPPWKGICAPAILPLTTDYLPPEADLVQTHTISSVYAVDHTGHWDGRFSGNGESGAALGFGREKKN